jgi:hypothetical protein
LTKLKNNLPDSVEAIFHFVGVLSGLVPKQARFHAADQQIIVPDAFSKVNPERNQFSRPDRR